MMETKIFWEKCRLRKGKIRGKIRLLALAAVIGILAAFSVMAVAVDLFGIRSVLLPEKTTVGVEDENGVLIPGETVICAVGQRPNRDAVMALRSCAPWVREIGDCNRVSNITNAVYQGYHAALDV